jgi:hypothetical protein
MVVVVNLGGYGVYSLNCFSKDRANKVAAKFLKQYDLPELFT